MKKPLSSTRNIISTLAESKNLEILQLILEKPGYTTAEIVAIVNRSRVQVNRSIMFFRKVGLMVSQDEPRQSKGRPVRRHYIASKYVSFIRTLLELFHRSKHE